jgi:hypothetical protein
MLHSACPNLNFILVQREYHNNVAFDTIFLDTKVTVANRLILKMNKNRNFPSREYFLSKT